MTDIIEKMARAAWPEEWEGDEIMKENHPDYWASETESAKREAMFAKIRAALAVAEAEGWVLVPKEPPTEMEYAGEMATCNCRACDCEPHNIYRAMLTAAPKP